MDLRDSSVTKESETRVFRGSSLVSPPLMPAGLYHMSVRKVRVQTNIPLTLGAYPRFGQEPESLPFLGVVSMMNQKGKEKKKLVSVHHFAAIPK
ncbi:uncharacterized protein BO97DRAFT_405995 [Aspergillus homomorphus CBS 101889]|uniref:Uncharacterized protein n=1 Tax=Aspergillus homomorphus (strain CBS 101889) TaxID=1450537 RepID=A0A395HXM9_ASPHC|nr:hypothetical protein BO97DRAFT_405995 [Aspergillus homomorphus CBS 101889]RAL11618.1 hypothetical protein BO97DRAFT_405995 [Aspergillus homomorphus CBS 101889]